MSQYLSKEEIKQWRSSLEKITLEEYAKKLGKVLEEDKRTSDIIDIVMQNEKRFYSTNETYQTHEIIKAAKKAHKAQEAYARASKRQALADAKSKLKCIKPLTKRENVVLSHFIENKGKVVFAKDLATILDIPCDYVYKYIKNLRSKICDNALQNAEAGGYILNYDN